MNRKQIIKICIVLSFMVMPVLAATGNAQSAKDIIGNPITVFNQLPDSVQNGILLVTGLMLLGALVAVIYGVSVAIGKSSLGSTSSDAKMRSEGVGALISIVAVVVLAILVLAFVFWYFQTGNI